jgi:sulfatase modifying factor 1
MRHSPHVNHLLVASVAIGLSIFRCSDAPVVLGWNADAGDALAPSCQISGAGLTNCGADLDSCCTSLDVTGGTFYRTYENSGSGPSGEADPASVSSFRLDKYLVTVGRFRRFVVAWNGGWTPPAGSGKHTYLNGGKGLRTTGGGYEPGWMASDDGNISPTDAHLACAGPLVPDLAADSHYGTWTPSPGTRENLPISCVNWYEAYAFCIWDGGFLPSDAEGEYAAAGGRAQREYPWGTTDPGTASLYAIYGCNFPGGSGSCTGVTNIAPVGTAARGAGLWGQEDLAGSLWEWNLDLYASYANPCADCVNLTGDSGRVARGGDFNTGASRLSAGLRHPNNPADKGAYAYGIRCARSLP